MTERTRQQALTVAWDQVAMGYDAYFPPRFAPWLRDACEAIQPPLPPGAIVVPCCGTGHELVTLAQQHPDRGIFGVDLSAGMLQLAYQRTRHLPAVQAQVADAMTTEGWPPCAAVVSLFGLQQVPDPPLALRRWTEALAPGGLLSVVFWPAVAEEAGPFFLFRDLIARALPAPGASWEGALVEAIQEAGGEILRDELPAHEMRHDDATTFLDAMLSSGPGRSLALAQGDAWVDEFRQKFLAQTPPGPLVHRPHARHLVARKG
jgi:ubiquinone/menaquinone biosynthesis C-methylase UbiE